MMHEILQLQALLQENHRLQRLLHDVEPLRTVLTENTRMRAILAALREPSDAVEEAALKEYRSKYCKGPLLILHKAHHSSSLTQAIRAAVAAAEREVDG